MAGCLWYSGPVCKQLYPLRQYSGYSAPLGHSLLNQQFLPTDIGNEMFCCDVLEPDKVCWLAILLHIPWAQRFLSAQRPAGLRKCASFLSNAKQTLNYYYYYCCCCCCCCCCRRRLKHTSLHLSAAKTSPIPVSQWDQAQSGKEIHSIPKAKGRILGIFILYET